MAGKLTINIEMVDELSPFLDQLRHDMDAANPWVRDAIEERLHYLLDIAEEVHCVCQTCNVAGQLVVTIKPSKAIEDIAADLKAGIWQWTE